MNTSVSFAPKKVLARKDLDIRTGDTVRVHVKIEERGKTRIQLFEGLVLAVKHGREPGATFTVRKISNGVGVERIFPLYSPSIDKIEIVKRARVRQAKLYYIRTKVARDIRRKMRNLVSFTASTDDLVPVEEMIEEEMENVEASEDSPAVEDKEEAATDGAPEEKEDTEEPKEEAKKEDASKAGEAPEQEELVEEIKE